MKSWSGKLPNKWLTTDPLLLRVLVHIKKNIHFSKEDTLLVLLENHEIHCTHDAILYGKKNGTVMCNFAPHYNSSHLMQQ
jgi:hypothetical protein